MRSPASTAWKPVLAAGTVGVVLLALAAEAAPPPPPGAHAGECFEAVRSPPVYKTVYDTVPTPPVISYRHHPAVYEQVPRQVLVSPERVYYTRIPATYRTVARTRYEPGPLRTVYSPAVYRTIVDRTEISPAHLAWRYSSAREGFEGGEPGDVQAIPTGKVLCRILVPARYAYSRRRIMVQPSSAHEVRGPARRILCYERVVETPARSERHVVPAAYKTVMEPRVSRAAYDEKIVTPQAPRQVARRVLVSPGSESWRKMACKPRPTGERG